METAPATHSALLATMAECDHTAAENGYRAETTVMIDSTAWAVAADCAWPADSDATYQVFADGNGDWIITR